MAERKRSNFVDLSGQRFGGLTVIEPKGKANREFPNKNETQKKIKKPLTNEINI